MHMDWEPHDRHWIRLRGPWEVTWINADGTAEPAERISLPADWRTLFGDRLGTARFIRVFQKPTQLDADERVCITLSHVGAGVRCRFNDVAITPLPTPLGDATCWPDEDCCSFDVTDYLHPTNRLTFEITVKTTVAAPVGLHAPVLMEIVAICEDEM